MQTTTEEWRDIPDLYTRKYQISSLGRIRSIGKSTRILKPGKCCSEYGKVVLRKRGSSERKTTLIHHLVAEAFLGPRPEGMKVLHKDGNAHDSSYTNLYYGTSSQNTHDAYKHGTLKRGQYHHKAKLSEEQILDIMRQQNRRGLQAHLARVYGVDKSLIGLIRRRKIWKHITREFVR